jgi:hypothetical protein
MFSGDTGSLSSLGSSSPLHNIDRLTSNKSVGGIKSNTSNSSNLSTASTTSSISLINSSISIPSLIITSSHSQSKLESIQDLSTPTENSKDMIGAVKERLITKIDPVEMTAKSTIVIVPQDTVKRSAMLLSGPKFRLNCKEILKDKLTVNSDTIYSVSVSKIFL